MAIKKRLFRDAAAVGGATATPAPVTNAADSGTVIAEQTKALQAKNAADNAAEDLEEAKTAGTVADTSSAAAVSIGSCFGPWGALIGTLVAGGIQVGKEFTVNKDIKDAEARYADATAAAADAAAKAKAAADKIEADKAAQNEPDLVEGETPVVDKKTAVVDVGAVQSPGGSSLATTQVDAQNGAIVKTGGSQLQAAAP